MINLILANLPAVLGIVSMVLSLIVAVAHLVHRDAVAAQVQAILDEIDSLQKKQV